MDIANPFLPKISERTELGSLYPRGYFLPPDWARAPVPNGLADNPKETGRLSDELRRFLRPPANAEGLPLPHVAGKPDPMELLTESALAFLDGASNPAVLARAQALADLAVSGRFAYANFARRAPRDADLIPLVQARLTSAAPAAVAGAVRSALDRAYSVAWVLRDWRKRAERPGLGWIAVSGEDDPPHRPVNVPATQWPQHNLTVRVAATPFAAGRTVRTRFAVASARGLIPGGPMLAVEVAARRVPPDATPVIPLDNRIVLFLHGHSSRAEEFEDIALPLVLGGVTVISLDLPNNGYADLFDHNEISNSLQTGDIALERAPVLDFIEQFVVNFVDALDAQVPGFKSSLVGVIGGSLGGNLGLRLAQRRRADHPWLANVVSWSAASVWNPLADTFKEAGPNTTRSGMNKPETRDSRQDYLYNVFFNPNLGQYFINFLAGFPLLNIPPQPQMWYRGGDWQAFKTAHIEGALRDRWETYHPHFRRWHWRVALEQLLFSHRHRERYRNINARTLFLAGSEDNFQFANIYTATAKMGARMLDTPGRTLLLRNTGHSIHNERPAFLAGLIRGFFPSPPPSRTRRERWTEWAGLGGTFVSRITSANNEDGGLILFGLGDNRHVFCKVQDRPGSTFSGPWKEIGSLNGTQVCEGDPVAVMRGDNRLHLFVTCSQRGRKALFHVEQNAPNGGWNNWSGFNVFVDIAGNVVTAEGALVGDSQGTPAVALRLGDGSPAQFLAEFAQSPGSPDKIAQRLMLVCARLGDGNVHVRGQNSWDGWWTNGRNIGGGARIVGDVAMARNQDGRLEVFARDSNNRVLHRWENRPDDWSGPWDHLNAGGFTGDPAAVLDAEGRLNVFGRGGAGELFVSTQSAPNGGWVPWALLGGSLAPNAKPAVIRNAWGGLQVFVRWSDNTVRYRRQLPEENYRWADWEALSGVVTSDPTVSMDANGSLLVFALGTDRQAYFRRQFVS